MAETCPIGVTDLFWRKCIAMTRQGHAPRTGSQAKGNGYPRDKMVEAVKEYCGRGKTFVTEQGTTQRMYDNKKKACR